MYASKTFIASIQNNLLPLSQQPWHYFPTIISDGSIENRSASMILRSCAPAHTQSESSQPARRKNDDLGATQLQLGNRRQSRVFKFFFSNIFFFFYDYAFHFFIQNIVYIFFVNLFLQRELIYHHPILIDQERSKSTTYSTHLPRIQLETVNHKRPKANLFPKIKIQPRSEQENSNLAALSLLFTPSLLPNPPLGRWFVWREAGVNLSDRFHLTSLRFFLVIFLLQKLFVTYFWNIFNFFSFYCQIYFQNIQ